MIEESGRNSRAMADRRQLFAEMRMYFSVLLRYDGEHVDAFKEINTFINQRYIQLLRSDSKDVSEGSCEHWRLESGNSALHQKNKLHFKIYSNGKQQVLTND